MSRNRNGYSREYKGFVLSRYGQELWRAWHPSGVKLRADTLAGLKGMVTRFLAQAT